MPKSYLKKDSYFLLVVIFAAFIWAYSYAIHSSEFWSIYISKKYFDVDFFETIKIKPLFHFLLYLGHLVPLHDLQHIIAIKILFSILGCLQLYLLFKVLEKITFTEVYLRYFIFFATLSGSIFLENYFKIRTDQLCLSLFLFYLWKENDYFFKRTRYVFLFSLVFPLIGAKGVYFSVLTLLSHFSTKKINLNFNFKTLLKLLVLINVITYGLLLGWNSVLYFFNTYDSYAESLSNVVIFCKENFAVLSLIFFLILILLTQLNKAFIPLNLTIGAASLAALLIIFIAPQKFNFFLASFIPLFYILAADALVKLKKIKSVWYFIFILLIGTNAVLNVYDNFKNKIFHSNTAQFAFIDKVTQQLGPYQFTYLDGVGIFPRQNNTNCFVSPDDWKSNSHCTELLNNSTADIIIHTQRLSQLLPLGALPNKNYRAIGANVYLNTKHHDDTQLSKDIPPAVLVFGFEQ